MIWFRLICEHFLFHLLPLLLSWSHVMTLFYLLIAGFIFQVFWGHLIDESNGFRWLMGWPKSSFGFPITSQGINWINFLMFLSTAPPKYLSTTKSIFLLLSHHRSPGAASNSKSCCFYLQNMCQIHQTGNKIFFLIISPLKSFSVPHILLPGLLQWLLTGLLAHCLFRKIIPDHTSHSHIASFFHSSYHFLKYSCCFKNRLPWWWNSYPVSGPPKGLLKYYLLAISVRWNGVIIYSSSSTGKIMLTITLGHVLIPNSWGWLPCSLLIWNNLKIKFSGQKAVLRNIYAMLPF